MGVGSRRELDALIAQGRVEVNGRVAKVGDRIEGPLTVKIDGRVVLTPEDSRPQCRVLMYHKPEGELTTIKDPQDRPTVYDHLPKPEAGRWIYIGRLDLNTSGLLLFTTDGELANALMHPRGGIERVYAARIYGEVSEDNLKALTTGISLEDGMAHFDDVQYAGGEGRNQWYHVTLKEGRNREVRRLWEAVGTKVSRLIRIKYAGIELDPKLKAGQFRELTLREINKLREQANLSALKEQPKPPKGRSQSSRDNKGPRRSALASAVQEQGRRRAQGPGRPNLGKISTGLPKGQAGKFNKDRNGSYGKERDKKEERPYDPRLEGKPHEGRRSLSLKVKSYDSRGRSSRILKRRKV